MFASSAAVVRRVGCSQEVARIHPRHLFDAPLIALQLPSDKLSQLAQHAVDVMSVSMLALLHRANQIATESFTSAMGDSDLTPRQIQVLAAIGANEGASQTQIVEKTGVDRSTLADIVRRLQIKKLIERRRSKDDARAYVLKLSEGGKQALTIGQPALDRVEMNLLPAKGRSNLAALLQELIGSHGQ